MLLFWKTQVQFQHPKGGSQWSQIPVSGDPYALFWPSRAPNTHVVHMYMYTHVCCQNTQNIKINLKPKTEWQCPQPAARGQTRAVGTRVEDPSSWVTDQHSSTGGSGLPQLVWVRDTAIPLSLYLPAGQKCFFRVTLGFFLLSIISWRKESLQPFPVRYPTNLVP